MVERFVKPADQFRLPIVHLVDNPGFMIGVAAQNRRHDPQCRSGDERDLSCHGPARAGQTTTPPSMTMVWPVMKLAASDAR